MIVSAPATTPTGTGTPPPVAMAMANGAVAATPAEGLPAAGFALPLLAVAGHGTVSPAPLLDDSEAGLAPDPATAAQLAPTEGHATCPGPACNDHKDAATQSLLALLALTIPAAAATVVPATAAAANDSDAATPAVVPSRGPSVLPNLGGLAAPNPGSHGAPDLGAPGLAAMAAPAPAMAGLPSPALPSPATPETASTLPAGHSPAITAASATGIEPVPLPSLPTPVLPATAGQALAATGAAGSATSMNATATEPRHEALLELLGSRLQAQLRTGMQRAVIQLEPHLAGSVQLDIRHEAGALRIHLSASHDDVARQLQGISEGLRQELAGRQFTEVSVQVGQPRQGESQPHGRHGQQRDDAAPAQTPGRALGESDEAYSNFAAALRRASPSGA